MKETQMEVASRYFDYLARCFPVMCASDEFHFLPRSQAAGRYYDRLDNLDADAIGECVSTLRDFKRQFDLLAEKESDLENAIDFELLKANAAGVLIELEKKESWRHNPLLYLKIAFIGLDHAQTKPADHSEERVDRVLARLKLIPRLLKQALDNLDHVPGTYHQAALQMAGDCEKYLIELRRTFSHNDIKFFDEALEKLLPALGDFGRFLSRLSPVPDEQFTVRAIENTLKDHFLSVRSFPEIFEIADEEWQENLDQLEKLRKQIDSSKSWQELYHSYCPSQVGKIDTFTLYRREIEQLQHFFRRHGFGEMDSIPLPELCETPVYLQSVRSSASFSAAFTIDEREKDFFYITPYAPHTAGPFPERRATQASELLRKRLHREYKFLTAHETFPGHHLLDWNRRRLENPVRRQIESPLFYEGWAYYVESLLTDYGYVSDSMDILVDWKRRLWRAARCRIDIGLLFNMLSPESAVDLLTTAGFSKEEATIQMNRFRLNPGYQLCYSLGRYEIMRLRETYAGRMGRDRFHKELLEGGELPFHLIERRFEAGYGHGDVKQKE